MKKYSKLTTAAMLGAMIVGAASGCGKADLIIWTGFGASYTKAVQKLVDTYAEQSGLSIDHQGQGSYDKLQTNMNNSVATMSYPNIANGYPDHFAGYIRSGIMCPLDEYIKAYNEEHGVDLISDFYPEYMTENQSLLYNKQGSAYTMGLPFNKSTEVMGYNGTFVAYAKSVDPSIKIPETWDEWNVEGPKMLAVMKTLYGKRLFAKGEKASDDLTDWEICEATVEEVPGKNLVMDCKDVNEGQFRLLCWDSTDNMFITIVRQWGGVYTTYTQQDSVTSKHGYAEFNSGENKEKTKAALNFFKKMNEDKIFGLPTEFDDSYSSSAFKANKCMFTICSSGGLSYNIASDPVMRFRMAPIPYKDADKKYVISQGTNLGLFDQGDEETKKKAFDAMVAFTTGELQSQFAVDTGYYPSSKSATTNAKYQALISQSNDELNETQIAYKESAILNENYYMSDEAGWKKFVDPGFVGSSSIRSEVKTIMAIVFAGEKTIDQILDESYSRLPNLTR